MFSAVHKDTTMLHAIAIICACMQLFAFPLSPLCSQDVVGKHFFATEDDHSIQSLHNQQWNTLYLCAPIRGRERGGGEGERDAEKR